MKKRVLIVASSVVSAVIVLTGLIGATVFAASDSTTTADKSTNPQSVFAEKVATILGIDQDKVEAAFEQAQKEMQSEALDNRLANMVENGVITQDQADQYKSWLESKPDVPAMMGGSECGPQGGGGGMMGMGRGFRGPNGDFGNPPSTSSDQSQSQ
jgi:hypothetical protein